LLSCCSSLVHAALPASANKAQFWREFKQEKPFERALADQDLPHLAEWESQLPGDEPANILRLGRKTCFGGDAKTRTRDGRAPRHPKLSSGGA
jgi:hypothetical protein